MERAIANANTPHRIARSYHAHMVMRFGALVVCVVACGGAGEHVTVPPAVLDQGGSELRVGDYVVYRFSGSFTETPVTLRERVVARDAGRITIEVDATRGKEARHWIQVGADSADARWNNAVDEIYVTRESGARERLPNPDNAMLARLYEWVTMGAEGDATAVETSPCQQLIATMQVACTCERATHTTMKVEQSRCPSFAWQRGPGRWTNTNGVVVWQVEVIDTTPRAP
jgi:hypothetical protein